MMKWFFSVVILLGLGVSVSEAQPYQRPNTNPYNNPGTTPFFNPYLGGSNFGNSNYGPFLGNPNAMQRPGAGVAPGGLAPDATGAQAVSALGNAGTLDPLGTDITGHRTAFNSYSRYFNNQGGSFGTTPPGGLPQGLNPNTRTNNRGSFTIGARPPQGVGITTQP